MNTAQNGVAPRSSGQLGQILRDLETELRRLSEQPAGEQDFERVEGELHQLFAVAERATLAHELERLDVDRPEVSIEGRHHRRVLCATETYTSAVGPITVTRTLYRAGSEQAVVPLEFSNSQFGSIGADGPRLARKLLRKRVGEAGGDSAPWRSGGGLCCSVAANESAAAAAHEAQATGARGRTPPAVVRRVPRGWPAAWCGRPVGARWQV